MFNALRSDELLAGVARVLRLVAERRGALDDYELSQVLSALSVTNLLASEQRGAPALLKAVQDDLDAVLRRDGRPLAGEAKAAIDAAVDGVMLGDAISDLFARLAADDPTRIGVRRALRRMIDSEVAGLARAAA